MLIWIFKLPTAIFEDILLITYFCIIIIFNVAYVAQTLN